MRDEDKNYSLNFNRNTGLQKRFAQKLLRWNTTSNRRLMPWKGEKDPYRIWLSEVILQQTRVEQGLQYYYHFITTYPTIRHLAAAPEQQVFKLWEGLGYYSRCRNLIHTANYISKNLNGAFPNQYKDILALKGIGHYTAAAIASFAYNLPYAVLDGNVFRVLSRIFDIEIPIDSTEGKKLFTDLAQEILPKKKPALYNQAIMDFGATICKPAPDCSHCFLNKDCRAFQQNKQLSLPVKSKRIKIKERWFNYMVLEYGNEVAVHQRLQKDIWQSLYEFVLIETTGSAPVENLLAAVNDQFNIIPGQYQLVSSLPKAPQKLSHQLIHFCFITLQLKNKISPGNFIWVNREELSQYAFPKTLYEYLNDKTLRLF